MASSSHTAECSICTNSYKHVVEIVSIDTDPVCRGCIINMFQRAADNESNYPVMWGQRTLKIDDFHKIIPYNLRRRYYEKENEYQVPPAERIFCNAPSQRFGPFRSAAFARIAPSCGTFLGRRAVDSAENDREVPQITCSACNVVSCLGCGETTDIWSPHTCKQAEIAEADRAFNGLVRGKDYQICPNKRCGRRIELADGCNHIYCMCMQQFCFVCGEPATNGSQHWTKTSPEDVKCPRYNQPTAPNALYDDANIPNADIGIQTALQAAEAHLAMMHGVPQTRADRTMPFNRAVARRNAIFGVPEQGGDGGSDAEAGAEDVGRRARSEEARRRVGGARGRALEEHARRQAIAPQQQAEPTREARRTSPHFLRPMADDSSTRQTHFTRTDVNSSHQMLHPGRFDPYSTFEPGRRTARRGMPSTESGSSAQSQGGYAITPHPVLGNSSNQGIGSLIQSVSTSEQAHQLPEQSTRSLDYQAAMMARWSPEYVGAVQAQSERLAQVSVVRGRERQMLRPTPVGFRRELMSSSHGIGAWPEPASQGHYRPPLPPNPRNDPHRVGLHTQTALTGPRARDQPYPNFTSDFSHPQYTSNEASPYMASPRPLQSVNQQQPQRQSLHQGQGVTNFIPRIAEGPSPAIPPRSSSLRAPAATKQTDTERFRVGRRKP